MVDPTDSLVQREPTALWRNVLDGVLVHIPGDDEPLHITTPGDVVWQFLAEPITADELAERIAREYHTSSAVVQADIEPVLTTLLDAGAIRMIPSATD